MALRKAVFFDRDGVVNACPGEGQFVLGWDQFRFMPDVRPQLARLRSAGFFLALITNQSGVGRGLMTLDALHHIHDSMQRELGSEYFEAIYYCSHAPNDGCSCRKPSPFMILSACREHRLDPYRSFAIGDQTRDIVMGRSAGCRSILLRDPLPPPEALKPEERPDFRETVLARAVDWILSHEPSSAGPGLPPQP